MRNRGHSLPSKIGLAILAVFFTVTCKTFNTGGREQVRLTFCKLMFLSKL